MTKRLSYMMTTILIKLCTERNNKLVNPYTRPRKIKEKVLQYTRDLFTKLGRERFFMYLY